MSEEIISINNIYLLFEYFKNNTFTDLHMGNQGIYLRDKIGNIKKLKYGLHSETNIMFAKNMLSPEKYIQLIAQNEVDLGYSYQDNRFRLNFYYDSQGLNIAIRKLANQIPSLSDLFIPTNLAPYFLKKKGLILVTGPTNSGKTSTLASIVNYINIHRMCHIITLEDPIEYVFESNNSLINQREVGSNTKSWNNGIKYSLRQDPDVIVVGEMRDTETIENVLNFVEVGHLVISTLHTIDAVQSILRIINVFPEGKQNKIAIQLSLALELVISQRLIARKDGSGRVCAREIMIKNNAISNQIRKNHIEQIYGVIETQSEIGMQTMDYSLAELVADNAVDISTIKSYITNEANFKQILKYKMNNKNAGK